MFCYGKNVRSIQRSSKSPRHSWLREPVRNVFILVDAGVVAPSSLTFIFIATTLWMPSLTNCILQALRAASSHQLVTHLESQTQAL